MYEVPAHLAGLRSYQEIADAMGITLQDVRTAMRGAMRKLRKNRAALFIMLSLAEEVRRMREERQAVELL